MIRTTYETHMIICIMIQRVCTVHDFEREYRDAYYRGVAKVEKSHRYDSLKLVVIVAGFNLDTVTITIDTFRELST